MPKLEALIQCAGESFYVNDTPTSPREVFCAFVPTEISVGEIESIDPSIALVSVTLIIQSNRLIFDNQII